MCEVRKLLRDAWDAAVTAEKARVELLDYICELEHPREDYIIELINQYLDISSCGGAIICLFDDVSADDIEREIKDLEE